MEIQDAFDKAVADSKQLGSKPDNATLLRLYSLYKQATEGDAPAENRTGAFDFVGKAKYEAWVALSGKTKEEAVTEYVVLVEELKQTN